MRTASNSVLKRLALGGGRLRDLASAVVVALTFVLSAVADDWPNWRGPDRNGISTEAGFSTDWPTEGPRQLWKKSVGSGYASVAVSQGRLFTAGNSNEIDTVVCLDAE